MYTRVRYREWALEQVFRIENPLRDLPAALDAVEESCRAEGLARESVLELRLVAEEVLTNIVKYAHPGADSRLVELRLSVSAESVRMEFRDDGDPFNPLAASAPDLETPTAERDIGGLGVHLVKSMVDRASYSRDGGLNLLILTKRIRPGV